MMKAPTLFIWLSLMQCAFSYNRVAVRAEEEVQDCAGMKIAILDLNDLSAIGGYAKCNLEVTALLHFQCINTQDKCTGIACDLYIFMYICMQMYARS